MNESILNKQACRMVQKLLQLNFVNICGPPRCIFKVAMQAQPETNKLTICLTKEPYFSQTKYILKRLGIKYFKDNSIDRTNLDWNNFIRGS